MTIQAPNKFSEVVIHISVISIELPKVLSLNQSLELNSPRQVSPLVQKASPTACEEGCHLRAL